MPTRPALKVYLSPERAAELQALAAEKGLSMSAVARQLIYQWLYSIRNSRSVDKNNG